MGYKNWSCHTWSACFVFCTLSVAVTWNVFISNQKGFKFVGRGLNSGVCHSLTLWRTDAYAELDYFVQKHNIDNKKTTMRNCVFYSNMTGHTKTPGGFFSRFCICNSLICCSMPPPPPPPPPLFALAFWLTSPLSDDVELQSFFQGFVSVCLLWKIALTLGLVVRWDMCSWKHYAADVLSHSIVQWSVRQNEQNYITVWQTANVINVLYGNP